jgi:ferrochelatase
MSSTSFGCILLNMGGPRSLQEIQPYLSHLFADPLIIQLPFFLKPWQNKLAAYIARKRSPMVADRYRQIGGKSCLDEDTQQLVQQLKSELGIPVTYAMRYLPPNAADALTELGNAGVNHIIAIPLFPQFSNTTSQSSITALEEHMPFSLELTTIKDHYQQPLFINAQVKQLQHCLSAIADPSSALLLFTAHSLPLAYTRQGDPYIAQIQQTVHLIQQQLPIHFPVQLAFQSKMGPMKWHGPDLSACLDEIRRQHYRTVIVHPISFVLDNLETKYDLDIVFRKQCLDAGVKQFIRVPAIGLTQEYTSCLKAMITETICRGNHENL